MGNSSRKLNLSPKLKLGVGRGLSTNRILKYTGGTFLLIALVLTANTVRLVWVQASLSKPHSTNPQVLGASDTNTAETPSSNFFEFVEYTVEKGDTLFNVSQKYSIKWTTLATINDLKSPFNLKPGQVLKIPKQ